MYSLLSAAPIETDDPQGKWVLAAQWEHHRTPWQPPIDVFENSNVLIVRMEIAGMQPDDFQLQLTGQTLHIRGHRRDPDLGTAYHRLEIPFGHFQVSIALPAQIDEHKIEAEYRDGFLRVYLPKSTPHTVPVHPST